MTAKKRKEADREQEASQFTETAKKARTESKTQTGKKDKPSSEQKKAFLSAAHEEWNDLFKHRLPQAAREKDSCQKKWPVQLDHCFGRIILDNVIGKDKPWTAKLKSPAIRNMSEDQAAGCNALAKAILDGSASLVDLDEKSLALRGKKSKAK